MDMFSVFSNKLINWYKQGTKRQNPKLAEAYAEYVKLWTSHKYHRSMFYIQLMIPDFVEPNKSQEMSMEWASNDALRTVEYWITNNIFVILNDLHPKTLGVRIRIATGMMNKLVNEGKLSRELAILFHEGFVENLGKVGYDLNVEQLPF